MADMSNLGSATFVLRSDTSQYDQGLRSAESRTKQTFSAIGKVITGAAVGGGIAFGAMFDDVVKKQHSFRETFTLLPDTTESEFNKLSAKARSVAAEMNVNWKDMSKALYDSISAGIPKNNVIDFLKTAAQGAVGGVATLANSVDLLTSTVNAFRNQGMTASRGMDILFATVRKGKTTITELAQSFHHIGPVAANMNISLEEIGAAIATLTVQGVASNIAGRQLRNVLSYLADPTKKAGAALEELTGKSLSQFIAEGKTATEVLNMLASSMSPDNFRQLFSIEGRTAAVGLIGENYTKFAENYKATMQSVGATNEAYQKMADTLFFKIGSSWLRIKEIFSGAVEESVPIVERLFDTTIIPAIDRMDEWFTTNRENIASFMSAIYDNFAPVVSYIVSGSGLILQGFTSFFSYIIDNKALLTGTITAIGFTLNQSFGPTFRIASIALNAVAALGYLKEELDKIVKANPGKKWEEYGVMLMHSVARGIIRGGVQLWNAAVDIFTDIRKLLPFSDAEEGPFSDLTYSGSQIVESLAYGVMENESALAYAVSDSLMYAQDEISSADGAWFNAGASIPATMAGGVAQGAQYLYNSVRNVFTAVRNLLPFSDAKEGPLANLTRHGESIILTLATGVRVASSDLNEEARSTLGVLEKTLDDWAPSQDEVEQKISDRVLFTNTIRRNEGLIKSIDWGTTQALEDEYNERLGVSADGAFSKSSDPLRASADALKKAAAAKSTGSKKSGKESDFEFTGAGSWPGLDVGDAGEPMEPLINAVDDFVEETKEKITDSLIPDLTEIDYAGAFAGALAWIGANVAKATVWLPTIAIRAGIGIGGAVYTAFGAVYEWARDTVGIAATWLPKIISGDASISDAFSAVWTWISGQATAANWFPTAATVATWATTTFDEAGSWLPDWMPESLLPKISSEDVETAFSEVGSWLNKLKQDIKFTFVGGIEVDTENEVGFPTIIEHSPIWEEWGEAIFGDFYSTLETVHSQLTGSEGIDWAGLGETIVGTIGEGVEGSGSKVTFGQAFWGLFRWIVDTLFPESDAKEGPFSTLTSVGANIVKTIGDGLFGGQEDFELSFSGAMGAVDWVGIVTATLGTVDWVAALGQFAGIGVAIHGALTLNPNTIKKGLILSGASTAVRPVIRGVTDLVDGTMKEEFDATFGEGEWDAYWSDLWNTITFGMFDPATESVNDAANQVNFVEATDTIFSDFATSTLGIPEKAWDSWTGVGKLIMSSIGKGTGEGKEDFETEFATTMDAIDWGGLISGIFTGVGFLAGIAQFYGIGKGLKGVATGDKDAAWMGLKIFVLSQIVGGAASVVAGLTSGEMQTAFNQEFGEGAWQAKWANIWESLSFGIFQSDVSGVGFADESMITSLADVGGQLFVTAFGKNSFITTVAGALKTGIGAAINLLGESSLNVPLVNALFKTPETGTDVPSEANPTYDPANPYSIITTGQEQAAQGGRTAPRSPEEQGYILGLMYDSIIPVAKLAGKFIAAPLIGDFLGDKDLMDLYKFVTPRTWETDYALQAAKEEVARLGTMVERQGLVVSGHYRELQSISARNQQQQQKLTEANSDLRNATSDLRTALTDAKTPTGQINVILRDLNERMKDVSFIEEVPWEMTPQELAGYTPKTADEAKLITYEEVLRERRTSYEANLAEQQRWIDWLISERDRRVRVAALDPSGRTVADTRTLDEAILLGNYYLEDIKTNIANVDQKLDFQNDWAEFARMRPDLAQPDMTPQQKLDAMALARVTDAAPDRPTTFNQIWEQLRTWGMVSEPPPLDMQQRDMEHRIDQTAFERTAARMEFRRQELGVAVQERQAAIDHLNQLVALDTSTEAEIADARANLFKTDNNLNLARQQWAATMRMASNQMLNTAIEGESDVAIARRRVVAYQLRIAAEGAEKAALESRIQTLTDTGDVFNTIPYLQEQLAETTNNLARAEGALDSAWSNFDTLAASASNATKRAAAGLSDLDGDQRRWLEEYAQTFEAMNDRGRFDDLSAQREQLRQNLIQSGLADAEINELYKSLMATRAVEATYVPPRPPDVDPAAGPAIAEGPDSATVVQNVAAGVEQGTTPVADAVRENSDLLRLYRAGPIEMSHTKKVLSEVGWDNIPDLPDSIESMLYTHSEVTAATASEFHELFISENAKIIRVFDGTQKNIQAAMDQGADIIQVMSSSGEYTDRPAVSRVLIVNDEVIVDSNKIDLGSLPTADDYFDGVNDGTFQIVNAVAEHGASNLEELFPGTRAFEELTDHQRKWVINYLDLSRKYGAEAELRGEGRPSGVVAADAELIKRGVTIEELYRLQYEFFRGRQFWTGNVDDDTAVPILGGPADPSLKDDEIEVVNAVEDNTDAVKEVGENLSDDLDTVTQAIDENTSTTATELQKEIAVIDETLEDARTDLTNLQEELRVAVETGDTDTAEIVRDDIEEMNKLIAEFEDERDILTDPRYVDAVEANTDTLKNYSALLGELNADQRETWKQYIEAMRLPTPGERSEEMARLYRLLSDMGVSDQQILGLRQALLEQGGVTLPDAEDMATYADAPAQEIEFVVADTDEGQIPPPMTDEEVSALEGRMEAEQEATDAAQERAEVDRAMAEASGQLEEQTRANAESLAGSRQVLTNFTNEEEARQRMMQAWIDAEADVVDAQRTFDAGRGTERMVEIRQAQADAARLEYYKLFPQTMHHFGVDVDMMIEKMRTLPIDEASALWVKYNQKMDTISDDLPMVYTQHSEMIRAATRRMEHELGPERMEEIRTFIPSPDAVTAAQTAEYEASLEDQRLLMQGFSTRRQEEVLMGAIRTHATDVLALQEFRQAGPISDDDVGRAIFEAHIQRMENDVRTSLDTVQRLHAGVVTGYQEMGQGVTEIDLELLIQSEIRSQLVAAQARISPVAVAEEGQAELQRIGEETTAARASIAQIEQEIVAKRLEVENTVSEARVEAARLEYETARTMAGEAWATGMDVSDPEQLAELDRIAKDAGTAWANLDSRLRGMLPDEIEAANEKWPLVTQELENLETALSDAQTREQGLTARYTTLDSQMGELETENQRLTIAIRDATDALNQTRVGLGLPLLDQKVADVDAVNLGDVFGELEWIRLRQEVIATETAKLPAFGADADALLTEAGTLQKRTEYLMALIESERNRVLFDEAMEGTQVGAGGRAQVERTMGQLQARIIDSEQAILQQQERMADMVTRDADPDALRGAQSQIDLHQATIENLQRQIDQIYSDAGYTREVRLTGQEQLLMRLIQEGGATPEVGAQVKDWFAEQRESNERAAEKQDEIANAAREAQQRDSDNLERVVSNTERTADASERTSDLISPWDDVIDNVQDTIVDAQTGRVAPRAVAADPAAVTAFIARTRGEVIGADPDKPVLVKEVDVPETDPIIFDPGLADDTFDAYEDVGDNLVANTEAQSTVGNSLNDLTNVMERIESGLVDVQEMEAVKADIEAAKAGVTSERIDLILNQMLESIDRQIAIRSEHVDAKALVSDIELERRGIGIRDSEIRRMLGPLMDVKLSDIAKGIGIMTLISGAMTLASIWVPAATGMTIGEHWEGIKETLNQELVPIVFGDDFRTGMEKMTEFVNTVVGSSGVIGTVAENMREIFGFERRDAPGLDPLYDDPFYGGDGVRDRSPKEGCTRGP